jgi:hypothetical protein
MEEVYHYKEIPYYHGERIAILRTLLGELEEKSKGTSVLPDMVISVFNKKSPALLVKNLLIMLDKIEAEAKDDNEKIRNNALSKILTFYWAAYSPYTNSLYSLELLHGIKDVMHDRYERKGGKS